MKINIHGIDYQPRIYIPCIQGYISLIGNIIQYYKKGRFHKQEAIFKFYDTGTLIRFTAWNLPDLKWREGDFVKIEASKSKRQLYSGLILDTFQGHLVITANQNAIFKWGLNNSDATKVIPFPLPKELSSEDSKAA
jgi:hypothetical protein